MTDELRGKIIYTIVRKLTSGKFWLTMITGVVFAFSVIKQIIPADNVDAIVVLVFMAYFSKKKED